MPAHHPSPDDVLIVSAVRTPVGRFGGAFADVPATTLGGHAIRSAVERAGVPSGAVVDEVLMGNVLGAGIGQAPARRAALAGGLPDSTPATAVNRVCGSGLKALMLGAAEIRVGDAGIVVAGGMESMSRAPYLLDRARFGYRLGDGTLRDGAIADGLWCSFEDCHMGTHAERVAIRESVSRADQDAFALRSHERAVAAADAGRFDDEIVPVTVADAKGRQTVVAVDETPRRDSTLEALARLRPAFPPPADPEGDGEAGTVTAGNAPGLSDGAAATVLASRATADRLGLRSLARIVGYAQAEVAPRWLFLAPIEGVRKLVERTGIGLDEVDLVELNEAFAAQALADIRGLGLDEDRVNVNGGAIALGHPIGASGARIVATLVHELRRRGGRFGIAALCLGGGGSVAMLVEAIPPDAA
jgi:acetyl-CoA C-acetyltransferase